MRRMVLTQLFVDQEMVVSGIGYAVQALISCDVDLTDGDICEIRIQELNLYDWQGNPCLMGGSEFINGRVGLNAFIYDSVRELIRENCRREIIEKAKEDEKTYGTR